MRPYRLGKSHHNSRASVSCFALACCFSLSLVIALPAQESRVFDDQKIVRYEERLKFYLDFKTRDYLTDMAAKERVLLETVRNLTTEIKQRGVIGAARDEAGFARLYGDMQRLIDDYGAELDAVLAILEEIKALSQTLEQEKRYDLLDQFGDLRQRLMAVLDSRTLHKDAVKTGGYRLGLLREYNVEVDSVLKMYNRLERFERAAATRQDTTALRLARRQKEKIQDLLAEMQVTGEAKPALPAAYLSEVEDFLAVLGELDKLEKPADRPLDDALEIESVRRQILVRLDRNLLKLVGYSDAEIAPQPVIDQAFQVWRVNRLATFEVSRMEYAILKRNLLESGTPKERARMLNRELTDALLNYAAERYQVAELQLQTIMEEYGTYFSRWDAVRFYRTECLYARGVLDEAYQGYEQLLRDYPDSDFRGMLLLRLVTIAQHLDWHKEFFSHFETLDSLGRQVDSRILERVRYLAGYYSLQRGDFGKADTLLGLIPQGGKYGLPARYLRAIAQVNRGNTAGALVLFREVAGMQTLPWSDPAQTAIRNDALLRLGYIHYERGEYLEAIKYFEQVSRGATSHDQSRLAKAWSQMHQGNWSEANAELTVLTRGYVISDYVYEAMVLSAHCKRMLDQPQAAMRDLRYVTNARGVLELSRDYNEERGRIVAQMNELDRLEREVLERQDRSLYEIVARTRQALQATLLNFNYRGPKGNLRSEESDEERQRILEQIQSLDVLVAQADSAGLVEVSRDAAVRRNRLINVLKTYQADRRLTHVNYLVDYPLAIKESGAEYRRDIVNNLMAHLESEQARVKSNIADLQTLLLKGGQQVEKYSLELRILQEDLANLQQRVARFRTWLSGYQVEAVRTDVDHWADLSGYGLSDLTFQQMEERERKMERNSQNLAAIDNLLRTRRANLEERLKRFDAEMRRIEEALIEQQVQLDKLEHKKYFEGAYFDTSESELGSEPRPDTIGLPEELFPQ